MSTFFKLNRGTRTTAATIAMLFATIVCAQAHHPMGGKLPSTFLEGFLSGIGHPVIGPDHLAFIVAIGIAAAFVPAGIRVIAAFVATSTLGVIVHAATLNVPLAEQAVALSVVLAGALIAFGQLSRLSFWQPFVAVAGLFHGYAFGEAIVGADRAVIGTYLIGLAIVASIIAFAVMQFTAKALKPSSAAATTAGSNHLRSAGTLLACIGVVMFAGSFIAA